MPFSGDVSERGESEGVLMGHSDHVEDRHGRRGRVSTMSVAGIRKIGSIS